MGQIKQYLNRSEVTGAIDPRRADPDAFGALGKGVAELGGAISGVGDMLNKREEQQELSDLHAKMSETHAQFTNEWQETLRTADPGDTTIAQKFNEKFTQRMDELGEGLGTRGGRLYFQKASADLKGHFLTSAMAGQAELAGVKAKIDFTKAVQSQSSSLMNDPSSFDMVLKMQGEGVDNLVNSGLLPRAKAEELKLSGQQELAKSAVRGWAKLNPEEAKAQLNGGKWDNYFDGDVKKQLLGEADQEIRGKEIEAERARAEQRRALEEKRKALQNDFLVKMNDGKLSAKEILNSNLDAFGSGSKEQFLQMMKVKNEDRALKTDGEVYSNLFNRIHAPDNDPKKIKDVNELNKFVGNGITFSSLNQLRDEFEGKNTPEGQLVATMRKELTDAAGAKFMKKGAFGVRDPKGVDLQLQFHEFIAVKEREQRKAGKPLMDLYRADSPDYIGNALNSPQFQRSPIDVARDRAAQMRSSLKKSPDDSGSPVGEPAKKTVSERLPGETAVQWKKRVGR